jgi:hypothetical protein
MISHENVLTKSTSNRYLLIYSSEEYDQSDGTIKR